MARPCPAVLPMAGAPSHPQIDTVNVPGGPSSGSGGLSFLASALSMRARICHVRPVLEGGAHGVFGRAWCSGQAEQVPGPRSESLPGKLDSQRLPRLPEYLAVAEPLVVSQ